MEFKDYINICTFIICIVALIMNIANKRRKKHIDKKFKD